MKFLQLNDFLYMIIEMAYVLTGCEQEADLWVFVKKCLNYLLKIGGILPRRGLRVVQDQQHLLVPKEVD